MSSIHFELPAEKKAAYVRAAQQAGEKLIPWIIAALDDAATPNPPAGRSTHYYGIQTEGNGSTLWKFARRDERDAWVAGKSVLRAPLAARDVQRALNSPGHYVRWARPEFAH